MQNNIYKFISFLFAYKFLLASSFASAHDRYTTEDPTPSSSFHESVQELDDDISEKLEHTTYFIIRAPNKSSVSSLKPLSQGEINEQVTKIALITYRLINTNFEYPSLQIFNFFLRNWTSELLKITSIDDPKRSFIIPSLQFTGDLDCFDSAIKKLIATPKVTIECAIAANLVSIICLQNLLGKELFIAYVKKLAQEIQQYPSLKDSFFYQIPIHFLKKVYGSQVPVPGSLKSINNVTLYQQFKPHGYCKTQNVFCVGVDQYIGFEPKLFKDGPRTLRAVENDCLKEFLRDDDVEKDAMLHKHYCQLFSDPHEFYKTRRQDEQTDKQRNFYEIFDEKLINRYITESTFQLKLQQQFTAKKVF